MASLDEVCNQSSPADKQPELSACEIDQSDLVSLPNFEAVPTPQSQSSKVFSFSKKKRSFSGTGLVAARKVATKLYNSSTKKTQQAPEEETIL